MAKWFRNLIPWRILHKSTVDLKDKELEHQKEINKDLKEDKRNWRDAYFQRNTRKS